MIHGTPHDDRLFGGAGDDIIHGHAGDDLLDGGVGDDQLFGGPGNDDLLGGAGQDQLFGGTRRRSASQAAAATIIFWAKRDETGSTAGRAMISSMAAPTQTA